MVERCIGIVQASHFDTVMHTLFVPTFGLSFPNTKPGVKEHLYAKCWVHREIPERPTTQNLHPYLRSKLLGIAEFKYGEKMENCAEDERSDCYSRLKILLGVRHVYILECPAGRTCLLSQKTTSNTVIFFHFLWFSRSLLH